MSPSEKRWFSLFCFGLLEGVDFNMSLFVQHLKRFPGLRWKRFRRLRSLCCHVELGFAPMVQQLRSIKVAVIGATTKASNRGKHRPTTGGLPNLFCLRISRVMTSSLIRLHQFHRVIQSTDWSRKAQLAGRSVEDLRVHELCFRGMNEFSLRMLSEGRFQSIVWTRNTAESVLVTQLLKSIREMKADVDAVALECIKEQGLPVPDKHKQAASFMEPLVDVLLKEIKSRVPAAAASSSADF